MSTVRYLLRSVGRPTPFGLFAGVAGVRLGGVAQADWGDDHRAVARADTGWLAAIIARAEQCPELLERLDVAVADLAVRRGERLELPQGHNRVTIRWTPAVAAVWELATAPVRFGALAGSVAQRFSAKRATVEGMLTELVRQGFLQTSLRAPFTVTDPFAHLTSRLRAAGAATLPTLASLLRDLDNIQAGLDHHNDGTTAEAEQKRTRVAITRRMRELSPHGRTPLAVDLLLDCTVRIPSRVAYEMERAASALLRLTRHPVGDPAWHSFHTTFAERYGTGTLVPLSDVLDPDVGLGYPAGFCGSLFPEQPLVSSDRDNRLLALAWQAMADSTREVVLTDDHIADLAGDALDERYIPPHVELSARIHAASTAALDRGEFLLVVAPARSAGTLTSRFTPVATGSGLDRVYRSVPTATEGALRVQMSFGPLYPHAENICRVPAYLDHLLSLGEHRESSGATLITIDDLAVTATRDRLYLVSLSRRQVIEPQVFHALALDKQPPPLARFLAQLPRAFSAAWYQFDWGPHAGLPFLPQVRYRRTILSPAQWRLSASEIPPGKGRVDQWVPMLDRWRRRWGCPVHVDLRDADRTLRLNLDEPAHATLLHAHLKRRGQAILYPATPICDYGWIGGRAHEVAFPLVTTRSAAPSPLRGSLPVVTNTHGHLPGAVDTAWLSARVYTHPERMNDLITMHLPVLLAEFDTEPACWWLRYQSPQETAHLRLRTRVGNHGYATCVRTVGEWMRGLRAAGVAGSLILDNYRPETGRYGSGAAMTAAEDVFTADSRLVAIVLRGLTGATTSSVALTVANMASICCGLRRRAPQRDGMAGLPVCSYHACR